MKFVVIVKPKKGVLDPQGVAIKKVAEGYLNKPILSIKSGKYFEVEIDSDNAENVIEELASKILSNEVIEDYEVKKL